MEFSLLAEEGDDLWAELVLRRGDDSDPLSPDTSSVIVWTWVAEAPCDPAARGRAVVRGLLVVLGAVPVSDEERDHCLEEDRAGDVDGIA